MTDKDTAPTREATIRVLGDIMHVDNGHLKMSSLLPWWLAEAEAAVDFLISTEGLPHLAALASAAGMVTEEWAVQNGEDCYMQGYDDAFRTSVSDFDAVQAWADSETARANQAEAALAAETEHRIGLLASNESLTNAVYETQALLDKERARTECVRAYLAFMEHADARPNVDVIRNILDGEDTDHG